MRLGSGKLHWNMSILCLVPTAELDSSLIWYMKRIELVSFDPGVNSAQLMTI